MKTVTIQDSQTVGYAQLQSCRVYVGDRWIGGLTFDGTHWCRGMSGTTVYDSKEAGILDVVLDYELDCTSDHERMLIDSWLAGDIDGEKIERFIRRNGKKILWKVQ